MLFQAQVPEAAVAASLIQHCSSGWPAVLSKIARHVWARPRNGFIPVSYCWRVHGQPDACMILLCAEGLNTCAKAVDPEQDLWIKAIQDAG